MHGYVKRKGEVGQAMGVGEGSMEDMGRCMNPINTEVLDDGKRKELQQ